MLLWSWHYFSSNKFTEYLVFKVKSRISLCLCLSVTLQERLIKIQFTPINKTYHKFWHKVVLSNYVNYVRNQNGKVLEEALAGFNSDDVKTQHWDVYVVSKWSSLFCKLFKNLISFLCQFVTHNRKYRINRGSMWPTGQTSNNSVINISWWKCPLPSRPSLALLHPNSWLETHFISLLSKIIEYTVFQLSISHWFVFIETSTQYLKNLGGLMERSDSQPRQFMLSTINSFKLMIEFFVK